MFTSKKYIDSTNENESYIFRTGYNETIEGLHARSLFSFIIPENLGLEMGVVGMCIGDVRKIYVPPSLGYGMTGGDKDIPPFVSIAVEVELLDHYPRNYTPYYETMVSKKAEYPEKNASRYKRWLEDCEDAKKNGKAEPKFNPPYIQTPRYPYDFMKDELEQKGIEGYTEEEREEFRHEEETRRKMHEHDINNRRRREAKIYDLQTKLRMKKKLLEIQRDKEINATRVLTAPPPEENEDDKKKDGRRGDDAVEDDGKDEPEEETPKEDSPEMIEEKRKIAEIEDKWNAIIKKQKPLPHRLTKEESETVERERERRQRRSRAHDE